MRECFVPQVKHTERSICAHRGKHVFALSEGDVVNLRGSTQHGERHNHTVSQSARCTSRTKEGEKALFVGSSTRWGDLTHLFVVCNELRGRRQRLRNDNVERERMAVTQSSNQNHCQSDTCERGKHVPDLHIPYCARCVDGARPDDGWIRFIPVE